MAAVAPPRQTENSPARLRTSLVVALAAYVVLRLLLSVTAASTLAAHPVAITAGIRGQYLGLRPEDNPLLAPWQRFDALWYQRIAERGYRPDDGSTAFRPLYPALIRLLASVTGNTLLAALLIGNLCFIFCVMFVHNLAWRLLGSGAALRGTALYVVFPSSFFLLGAYTESLFVLCCAAALYAGYRGRWGWAGVAGLAAALARNQGGLLVAPLLVLYWQARRAGQPWWPALFLALPLAGSAAFPLYASAVVHAPPVNEVLARQWGVPLSPPWVTIGRYIGMVRAPGWHLLNSPAGNYVELWDLACALGFLMLIVVTARRLGLALTLYNLYNWVTAVSLAHSTSRYMLPLFPVYFVVGAWLAGKRLLFDLLLALCLAFYLFLAAQFSLWSWVA